MTSTAMSTTAATSDLTAKARIRIAALELFAERGIAAATMRQVAERAGVTVGLVTHHYGSKDALRRAVDEYVVELYRAALEAIPTSTAPSEVANLRNQNIARMLQTNSALRIYLRRAFVEPDSDGTEILERLTDLTRDEVRRLRDLKIASTARSAAEQTMHVMIQQLGQLLVQPLVDRAWAHLNEADSPPPRADVRLAASDQPAENRD